jgi:hypothetical protein
MKSITISGTTSLDEVMESLQNEDVLLVRNGSAVALLSPFDDDDVHWYIRERDPSFIESIARARQQVHAGKTISHSELKAKLGME